MKRPREDKPLPGALSSILSGCSLLLVKDHLLFLFANRRPGQLCSCAVIVRRGS
ncbi:hypothetical protein SAMN04489743_2113 [Pseudarthrobacter equi]|uniref:Lipoprotein n=1 Tax=Pseudarthrobacter equi TaxID=728066 RepID=A0A1H1YQB4_9MICC|nr:hypothetical protein SAMN04489743_2113 [Pseudarthrobacter equi]